MHPHHTPLLFSLFCNPSLSSALSRVKINHTQNIRGVHLRPYHYRQSSISFTSTRLHTKRSMDDSTKNITDIRKQKQLLRKQIRSRIRSVYPSPSHSASDDDIIAAKMKLTSQSNQVFDQKFKLPQYEAATSIPRSLVSRLNILPVSASSR